jgi:DHA1 family tetracycline resistance protein-like MFS transporter
MAKQRFPLLTVFLVVFIDLVGFGIVIPILPYYATQFGASASELGWLMAIYSFMQFLISPLWGRLSDRIGRRPVLLVSILGTALTMVFLGFARSLEWLFIGRLLAGACAANISTAYAYIADVTTEENRAKGMGAVGAAFGLGFIFGPAIGGTLAHHHNYALPMFFAAGLSAINLLFALFKLKEPHLSVEERSKNRTKRFDLANIRLALGDQRTRLAIGVFFLVTFAVTQMESIFAIYMAALFNFDARQAGMLLALVGIIMVIMQGGLVGRLAKRFGELRLIHFGLVVCGLGLLGFALSPTIGAVVISLSILGIGHGALHPSLSSLASLGASKDRRGATMGVFQSAGSLARVLGPPCAGLAYDHMAPNAPFLLGCTILAFAFAVSQRPARSTEFVAS